MSAWDPQRKYVFNAVGVRLNKDAFDACKRRGRSGMWNQLDRLIWSPLYRQVRVPVNIQLHDQIQEEIVEKLHRE